MQTIREGLAAPSTMVWYHNTLLNSVWFGIIPKRVCSVSKLSDRFKQFQHSQSAIFASFKETSCYNK